MSDQYAFERQVEQLLQRAAGPSRPVDASAVVDALPTRSLLGRLRSSTRLLRRTDGADRNQGGSLVFSALKLATASIVLALFGGLLLAGGVFTPDGTTVAPAAPSDGQSAMMDTSPAFPTGLFVATDRPDLHLEFLPDGTGHVFLHPGNYEVNITWASVGELWTQMTDDSAFSADRHVPATYYWDYDGEFLSFEPWGEELNPDTRGTTMAHDYRPIPGRRAVVVAVVDTPAGQEIYPWALQRALVPAAEAGPDVFDSFRAIEYREAAVDISRDQPITRDQLVPVE